MGKKKHKHRDKISRSFAHRDPHLERDCETMFHIIDRMTSVETASEFLRNINAHCLRRIHELAQERLEREASVRDDK